jgi:predicted nucleotidyltransferase component of viral defense system
MLERTQHEIILKKILADVFSDKKLQTVLAFKGGTCLYFFYDLDRFSTDLDFNLLSDKLDTENMTTILSKYLTLEENISKRNTWLWVGTFKKGKQKIKIEISKRSFDDTYENKDFYGFTVPTMSTDCMFAHKLCAITDRKRLQNRDIYDSLFMFEKGFKINEKIIKERTGKDLSTYYRDLIHFIEKKVKPNLILNGLGEVLNEKQKAFTKANLINRILFELKIRIKS